MLTSFYGDEFILFCFLIWWCLLLLLGSLWTHGYEHIWCIVIHFSCYLHMKDFSWPWVLLTHPSSFVLLACAYVLQDIPVLTCVTLRDQDLQSTISPKTIVSFSDNWYLKMTIGALWCSLPQVNIVETFKSHKYILQYFQMEIYTYRHMFYKYFILLLHCSEDATLFLLNFRKFI